MKDIKVTSEDKAPLIAMCNEMITRRRSQGVCELCGKNPPTQQFKAGCFIINTCEPCMENFHARLLLPDPPVLSEEAIKHCTTSITTTR